VAGQNAKTSEQNATLEPLEQPYVDVPKSQFEPMPQFLENLPIRLPEISSEDLEHFEDSKLDAAYEDRLAREGDHLKAITGASQIVAQILTTQFAAPASSANGTATAPAKVRPKIDFMIPDFSTEPDEEVSILPENPTEEDLWRYAQSHPAVKRTLRIFRGKIISVTKTD
jgi:hypothetical protein